MSKKKDLITVLNGYKEKYNTLHNQKLNIQQDPLLTPIGQEEEIKKLLDAFKPTVKIFHDKALEIIDTGLETLENSWKEKSTEKLMDGGYQAGLSNVIKMLELGSVQNKEDLQNIIDTYKDDFNALAVIKKVLEKSSIEISVRDGVTIPRDNREYNKRLLNQLRDNIDRCISDNSLRIASKSWNVANHGSVDVSMNMESMVNFVTTRLGDNLELIN